MNEDNEYKRYEAARLELNRLNAVEAKRANQWRKAAGAIFLLAGASLALNAYQATLPRLTPYIVEVDQLGQSQASRLAEQTQIADVRVIRHELEDFIKAWRRVTSDGSMVMQSVKQVNSMLDATAPAHDVVVSWYDSNNPLERAKEKTVHVNYVKANPADRTERTWLIEWAEVERDLTGQPLLDRPKFYAARVVINLVNPQTLGEAELNHLGVVITELEFERQPTPPVITNNTRS